MLTLDQATRAELGDLADREILATLRGQRGGPAAQDGREALGMTVSTALPRAAEAWRPLMTRMGVRARLVGAFSFGAPQVEFADDAGAPHTCALADVLIVVDDFRGESLGRRAQFVRTTVTAPLPERADLEAAAQLYRSWPAFRLRRSAHPERLRALSASDDTQSQETGGCAEISLGELSGWALCAADLAARPVRYSLGTTLVRMAIGVAGRPAVRGGQDDWSATVDELLARTIRAALTGLRSPTLQLRTITTVAGDAGTGHVLLENAMGLDLDEAVALDAAEGPVSVVHLCLDAPRARPVHDDRQG